MSTLREPLPGCAAPSQIRESTLSPRSWRSRGAAAAADSARLGHLSSLSLTQTSLLQLSSIAIGLTQRAGTSGERRAHWLRGARRSCSDYHISALPLPSATDRSASPRERIRAPEATCSGLRLFSPDAQAAWLLGCSGFWPPFPPPPPPPAPPCSFPAAPPARSPPVALLLRPALLGSPQSAGCVERGAHFSAAGGEWLFPKDKVTGRPRRTPTFPKLINRHPLFSDLTLDKTCELSDGLSGWV
uniref:uncharacterized protein LOC110597595 n=1 Tax=Ictidomys tridecemlineatus TaxID=43179 RepID=UPI001A9F4EF4|nr:uncharacterized protein LOC110597595 [Ictidomys tridecemlineatus]